MRTAYRYGPPGGRRMMRRTMMRRMMTDRAWCDEHERHRHGREGWKPSPAEELDFLEEYQRDLEEALADVADRVKTVRQAAEASDTPGN